MTKEVVKNAEIYGLESSIFRSGYPFMKKAPTQQEYYDEVVQIEEDIADNNLEGNKHIKRAIKLANAKGGGHDQFLSGITVSFDLTFSNKAWIEANRYTFLTHISSMSTMHKASELDIQDCCNEYVTEEAIKNAELLQHRYLGFDDSDDEDGCTKQDLYLDLLYNLPGGFELTSSMVTNYRCLKNIYEQRRNHRLPEWREFCSWIETLPLFEELIKGGFSF